MFAGPTYKQDGKWIYSIADYGSNGFYSSHNWSPPFLHPTPFLGLPFFIAST
jgi:hypothetical protein